MYVIGNSELKKQVAEVAETDNGTGISLRNWENFTLQRENPSTGYSWELNVSEGSIFSATDMPRMKHPKARLVSSEPIHGLLKP